jgi:CheY-like chemotaxis protein
MKRNEILLIEDSDSDAELAERTLRGVGINHPIRRFASGAQALEYLLQVERAPEATSAWPAVLLIDLTLPDLHGFDILDRLRDRPAFEKTLRIVLTGIEDLSTIKQAYIRGAASFLRKPLDRLEVLELVNSYPSHWLVPGPSSPPHCSI